MNNILQDAYDMHVHAGPDVIPRRMDDLELAAAYSAAGMKGFVIKSHYWDTAGRAFLVRKLYPDLDAVGTLVLNHSVGGLNPAAVEMAARYGVRMVFMPTIDAWNMLPAEEKRRRRLFEGDGRPDDPGRHPAASDTMSAARKDRSSTAATPSPIRILMDGKPVPGIDLPGIGLHGTALRHPGSVRPGFLRSAAAAEDHGRSEKSGEKNGAPRASIFENQMVHVEFPEFAKYDKCIFICTI